MSLNHTNDRRCPNGWLWGLKKLMEKIICWDLKRRWFYNIISACLEKEGRQIMNIEKLEKRLDTITKNSTELKEGSRSFEAKLNAIAENYTELKEGNQELKEMLSNYSKIKTIKIRKGGFRKQDITKIKNLKKP